eukprot:4323998-Pleurochrysis_carterae.AAC.7
MYPISPEYADEGMCVVLRKRPLAIYSLTRSFVHARLDFASWPYYAELPRSLCEPVPSQLRSANVLPFRRKEREWARGRGGHERFRRETRTKEGRRNKSSEPFGLAVRTRPATHQRCANSPFERAAFIRIIQPDHLHRSACPNVCDSIKRIGMASARGRVAESCAGTLTY